MRQIIRIGTRGGKIVADKGGKVEYQRKDALESGHAAAEAEPEPSTPVVPDLWAGLLADPRMPPVGTVILVNTQKGQHVVRIGATGVEYNGATYPSLTAVQKAIRPTSKWSPWKFFGLMNPWTTPGTAPAAPAHEPAKVPEQPQVPEKAQPAAGAATPGPLLTPLDPAAQSAVTAALEAMDSQHVGIGEAEGALGLPDGALYAAIEEYLLVPAGTDPLGGGPLVTLAEARKAAVAIGFKPAPKMVYGGDLSGVVTGPEGSLFTDALVAAGYTLGPQPDADTDQTTQTAAWAVSDALAGGKGPAQQHAVVNLAGGAKAVFTGLKDLGIAGFILHPEGTPAPKPIVPLAPAPAPAPEPPAAEPAADTEAANATQVAKDIAAATEQGKADFAAGIAFEASEGLVDLAANADATLGEMEAAWKAGYEAAKAAAEADAAKAAVEAAGHPEVKPEKKLPPGKGHNWEGWESDMLAAGWAPEGPEYGTTGKIPEDYGKAHMEAADKAWGLSYLEAHWIAAGDLPKGAKIESLVYTVKVDGDGNDEADDFGQLIPGAAVSWKAGKKRGVAFLALPDVPEKDEPEAPAPAPEPAPTAPEPAPKYNPPKQVTEAPSAPPVKHTVAGWGPKTWMARITGTHPKYKMQREFLDPAETVKGAGALKRYDLTEPGLYQSKSGQSDAVVNVLVTRDIATGELKRAKCSPERAAAIAAMLQAGHDFEYARAHTLLMPTTPVGAPAPAPKPPLSGTIPPAANEPPAVVAPVPEQVQEIKQVQTPDAIVTKPSLGDRMKVAKAIGAFEAGKIATSADDLRHYLGVADPENVDSAGMQVMADAGLITPKKGAYLVAATRDAYAKFGVLTREHWALQEVGTLVTAIDSEDELFKIMSESSAHNPGADPAGALVTYSGLMAESIAAALSGVQPGLEPLWISKKHGDLTAFSLGVGGKIVVPYQHAGDDADTMRGWIVLSSPPITPSAPKVQSKPAAAAPAAPAGAIEKRPPHAWGPAEQVEKALATTPVASRSAAPNGKFGGVFLRDGSGQKFGLHKPKKTEPVYRPNMAGKAQWTRELANYQISRITGIQLVPPTIAYKDSVRGDGTLMAFAAGMQDGHDGIDPAELDPEEVGGGMFHDLLCGAEDRIASNWMVGAEKDANGYRHLALIDNGLSLAPWSYTSSSSPRLISPPKPVVKAYKASQVAQAALTRQVQGMTRPKAIAIRAAIEENLGPKEGPESACAMAHRLLYMVETVKAGGTVTLEGVRAAQVTAHTKPEGDGAMKQRLDQFEGFWNHLLGLLPD